MTNATRPGEIAIRRYDFVEQGSYYAEGSIEVVPGGEYVRYDDHLAAMSRARARALSDGQVAVTEKMAAIALEKLGDRGLCLGSMRKAIAAALAVANATGEGEKP